MADTWPVLAGYNPPPQQEEEDGIWPRIARASRYTGVPQWWERQQKYQQEAFDQIGKGFQQDAAGPDYDPLGALYNKAMGTLGVPLSLVNATFPVREVEQNLRDIDLPKRFGEAGRLAQAAIAAPVILGSIVAGGPTGRVQAAGKLNMAEDAVGALSQATKATREAAMANNFEGLTHRIGDLEVAARRVVTRRGGVQGPDAIRHDYRVGGKKVTEAEALKHLAASAAQDVVAPAVERLGKGPMLQDQQRVLHPGIYKHPSEIISQARRLVAPEDAALKELFGVTRDDLYQMSKGRKGNITDPMSLLKLPKKPQGAQAARNLQTPANEQRLLDAMALAERDLPQLTQPMDSWYNMEPAFQVLEKLHGREKAIQLYNHLNNFTSMSSPGSDVMTEINRGTAANYLFGRDRFDDFRVLGGLETRGGAARPEDMQGILGHPYHKTSQAGPMEKYAATGRVEMDSAKVPLYRAASGVEATGFQTGAPVPDAHFSRAIGLGDTRTANVDLGASASPQELYTVAPWWRGKIAEQLGIEAVPAQARAWGLFGPQTGVTTDIGAPKLELLAIQIKRLADRLGIPPERARDLVLSGEMHVGMKSIPKHLHNQVR